MLRNGDFSASCSSLCRNHIFAVHGSLSSTPAPSPNMKTPNSLRHRLVGHRRCCLARSRGRLPPSGELRGPAPANGESRSPSHRRRPAAAFGRAEQNATRGPRTAMPERTPLLSLFRNGLGLVTCSLSPSAPARPGPSRPDPGWAGLGEHRFWLAQRWSRVVAIRPSDSCLTTTPANSIKPGLTSPVTDCPHNPAIHRRMPCHAMLCHAMPCHTIPYQAAGKARLRRHRWNSPPPDSLLIRSRWKVNGPSEVNSARAGE